MFTVSWAEEERTAATVEEVDRILDQVHLDAARDPQLVTVETEATGDTLAVGLGLDRSVLSYVGAGGDPPYFISVGDSDVDAPIAFRFNGHYSDFPMRCSVPTAVAREAMKHFCVTGKLSPAIRWEEG